MAFKLYESDLDSEELPEKLQDLASIVYTRHYYANTSEREDLLSTGVLKAYELLAAGHWDRSRGSLLNFLYSGMRNEMHNYLYRNKNKREVCYEDFHNESVTDSYFEADFISIPRCVIDSVCKEFRIYGNIEGFVAKHLKKNGFVVSISERGGEDNDCSLRGGFGREFYQDLIQRLSGAVIWKSMEFYR